MRVQYPSRWLIVAQNLLEWIGRIGRVDDKSDQTDARVLRRGERRDRRIVAQGLRAGRRRHAQQRSRLDTVALMQQPHVIEDADAIGSVEADDAVGAKGDVDTGGEHVAVAV